MIETYFIVGFVYCLFSAHLRWASGENITITDLLWSPVIIGLWPISAILGAYSVLSEYGDKVVLRGRKRS